MRKKNKLKKKMRTKKKARVLRETIKVTRRKPRRPSLKNKKSECKIR